MDTYVKYVKNRSFFYSQYAQFSEEIPSHASSQIKNFCFVKLHWCYGVLFLRIFGKFHHMAVIHTQQNKSKVHP